MRVTGEVVIVWTHGMGVDTFLGIHVFGSSMVSSFLTMTEEEVRYRFMFDVRFRPVFTGYLFRFVFDSSDTLSLTSIGYFGFINDRGKLSSLDGWRRDQVLFFSFRSVQFSEWLTVYHSIIVDLIWAQMTKSYDTRIVLIPCLVSRSLDTYTVESPAPQTKGSLVK